MITNDEVLDRVGLIGSKREGARVLLRGSHLDHLQYFLVGRNQKYMVVSLSTFAGGPTWEIMKPGEADCFFDVGQQNSMTEDEIWHRTSGQLLSTLKMPLPDDDEFNEAFTDFLTKVEEYFK